MWADQTSFLNRRNQLGAFWFTLGISREYPVICKDFRVEFRKHTNPGVAVGCPSSEICPNQCAEKSKYPGNERTDNSNPHTGASPFCHKFYHGQGKAARERR